MIHVKVLKSIDQNAAGSYEYEFDAISIGKNNRNDLILKDDKIPNYSVIFYIENNILFAKTNTPGHFCLHNGKKFSGKKKVEIGDIISIGSSDLEVALFKPTSEKINFSLLYEKFIKTYPHHKYILEALDREIENLEKI